jgi:hypothetical protein
MNNETELREQRLNRFITACLTENIESEDFNIKDTYAILGTLTNMPSNKINSARSNHSKLDREGMTYHLIKLCMRLFVAGLHTETPCDANYFPDPEYNFRTRYLEKRLKEPLDKVRSLKREIKKLEASDDKVEIRKLKEKVADFEAELSIKRTHIEKLERDLNFKEDQLKHSISKTHYEALKQENDCLQNLLNKTNS